MAQFRALGVSFRSFRGLCPSSNAFKNFPPFPVKIPLNSASILDPDGLKYFQSLEKRTKLKILLYFAFVFKKSIKLNCKCLTSGREKLHFKTIFSVNSCILMDLNFLFFYKCFSSILAGEFFQL
jgi:hypothetical protein